MNWGGEDQRRPDVWVGVGDRRIEKWTTQIFPPTFWIFTPNCSQIIPSPSCRENIITLNQSTEDESSSDWGTLSINRDIKNAKSKEFTDNIPQELGETVPFLNTPRKRAPLLRVSKSQKFFTYSFDIYHSARKQARQWKYKSKHSRHRPMSAQLQGMRLGSYRSLGACDSRSWEVHSPHGHRWRPWLPEFLYFVVW